MTGSASLAVIDLVEMTMFRYSAVKKLCCVEKPVASQVINFKTISNEKKVNYKTCVPWAGLQNMW